MKKAGVIIAALLCIALVCGGFFLVKVRSDRAQANDRELTEVEKLITKDLEKNYPATPREVVKLYNRIITCFYKEKISKDDLSELADQVLVLFDKQLRDNNPKAQYLSYLQADIANYAARSRYIAQSNVCDSSDILFIQDGADELAYVTASYFVKEGNSFTRTYQQYVLRKDGDGRWKILAFYQIEAPKAEGED